MSIQGDSRGLDGDTSVLLILTSIGETSLTSLGGRDDTGTLHKRVGKSGFPVIDCWRVLAVIPPAAGSDVSLPCAMTDMFLMFAGRSIS